MNSVLLASLLVTVGAGDWDRFDRPVEITLERPGPVRVVEVDARGRTLDPAVPCQLEPDGTLTFLMSGVTKAGAERRFQVLFEAPREFKPLVKVEEVADYQGQASFRIETPTATYYYHKAGAGFASLIDPDGNDWISYRPTGRSDGRYRGIPNLIHPENDFHPGGANSVSRAEAGPLKVSLHSETRDGAWAGRWDIFPHFARFTVLRAPRPYWFLYEGTPGGRLDLDRDWWASSDGSIQPITESWAGKLPAPQWVIFGDRAQVRVLFVVQHEPDEAPDQFWQMEGNMTVFGFGRQYRCCEKYLRAVPAHFTIGLVETADLDRAIKFLESAVRPLSIRIEP
jgi:hypothetical protein